MRVTALPQRWDAVMRVGVQIASGSVQIVATAPSIFTANSAGYGLAAAQLIRIKSDGSQSYEPVTSAVDFGPASDRLFLALYGTGVRGATTSVRIAGMDFSAAYAGPQGQYPGLDQVNVELARSLAGAGQVDVTMHADGISSNAVILVFK